MKVHRRAGNYTDECRRTGQSLSVTSESEVSVMFVTLDGEEAAECISESRTTV
jgi:hypothetical protein